MLAHGITIGTTLRELEKINGAPFQLAGFEWDYSGTVTSWGAGKLKDEFAGSYDVTIRLGGKLDSLSEQESLSVLGDKDFPSNNGVMQKLNPRIYQIIFDLK
jgi:hypothetical protein